MPELPEVETVRRMLADTVENKTIAAVEIYYDKVIDGDNEEFITRLQGETIRGVDRIGKYLVFILDSVAIISHLRMEGKYTFLEQDRPRSKHELLSLVFADGSQLRYDDVRRFGRLKLADGQHYREDPVLAKLGPEPKDADPLVFWQRIHKRDTAIKTLLLDQTIITGLGNIYVNEVLHRLGMHPKTPGKRISKKRAAQLLTTAAEILAEATALGGTTIHSFSALDHSGGYQDKLRVHGRKVCPDCGAPITKIFVGGRGTYFCPICQKRRG